MNKIVRIILSLVLTALVFLFAKTNSRGRPENYAGQENGYSFAMTSVPKAIEFTEATITMQVTPVLPEGGRVVFRRAEKGLDNIEDLGTYSSVAMVASDTLAGGWETDVKAGKKAGRFKYFFEVVDAEGQVLATFAAPDGGPFDFRYIGEVPPYVIGPHILFIFATVFSVVMALIASFGLVSGSSTDRYLAARWLFWSTVFAFLGGYPFGIPMNWYAFGGTWEGVPFGTDATDNKTQLLFVYLLFAWLAGLKSFYRGRKGRDLFSSRSYGLVGILATVVTLAIYGIPHSIQFSAGLTYAVCYGFTGMVALIYVIGYVRAGSRT